MSTLAILLLRGGIADAAALAQNCGGWDVIPNPGQGGLSAVTVVPGTGRDVWTVGYTPHGARVEHWNGKQWHIVPSPYTQPLLAIAAVSANDIWATGYGGIMHWDGKTWTIVSSSSNVTSLNGMATVSVNDAWAVGGHDLGGSHTRPIIEHWDGIAWSLIPSPNVDGGLLAVTAISTNDAWAVGYGLSRQLVEHWDGTAWSIIPTPGPPHNCGVYPSGIAAISTNDIWMVGSYLIACDDFPYYTLAEHWNGSQWRVVSTPKPVIPDTFSQLHAVAAAAPNNVWAVGVSDEKTLTEHWDGTHWSFVKSPDPQKLYDDLDAVAATSTGDFWAVGVSINDGETSFPSTDFYC
jgi:hypothetical protein